MEEGECGTKEGESKSGNVITKVIESKHMVWEKRRKRRQHMRAGGGEETPHRMPVLARNYVFKCLSM